MTTRSPIWGWHTGAWNLSLWGTGLREVTHPLCVDPLLAYVWEHCRLVLAQESYLCSTDI